jgi:arylsulfatase A-like enzyme
MTGCGAQEESPVAETWPPANKRVEWVKARKSFIRPQWRSAYRLRPLETNRFELKMASPGDEILLGLQTRGQVDVTLFDGETVIDSRTVTPERQWTDVRIGIPADVVQENSLFIELRSTKFLSVSDLRVLESAKKNTRPNVLIVLMDTMRRDHIGHFGYHRDTTPNLDRLAAESVVFTDAITHSGWTVPSVTSLFTSYYADAHLAIDKYSQVPIGIPTLAGAMKDQGYWTTSITTNAHIRPENGFHQGFDRFASYQNSVDTALTQDDRAADHLVKDLEFLRGHPWFVYLHLMGPHSPYNPPSKHWDRYQDPEQIISREELYEQFSKTRSWGPGLAFKYQCSLDLDDRLKKSPDDPRPPMTDFYSESFMRELAIALYDAEIRNADEAVGRVLDQLRELGVYDNTLIIFVTDHGEEFWDHGDVKHSNSLYGELVNMPLFIKLPGGSSGGTKRKAVGELVDIGPTIADYLGFSLPWDAHGESLRPIIEGTSDGDAFGIALLSRPVTVEQDTKRVFKYLRAVQDAERKAIYDEVLGVFEFYDLVQDPNEKNPAFEMPAGYETLVDEIDKLGQLFRPGLNLLFTLPLDKESTVTGRIRINQEVKPAFNSSLVNGTISNEGDHWLFEIRAEPNPDVGLSSHYFNPILFAPTTQGAIAEIELQLNGAPFPNKHIHVHGAENAGLPESKTLALDDILAHPDRYPAVVIEERPSVRVWSWDPHERAKGVEGIEENSELRKQLEALGYH